MLPGSASVAGSILDGTTAGLSLPSGGYRFFETVGLVAVSMFVGFLMALFVVRRSPRSLGYQRVPDASL